jgi:hypothetical protein
MHVVEIELDLLRRMLSSSGKIDWVNVSIPPVDFSLR